MFDAIAPRYDLLNTVLSFGTHRSWRAFAARCTAAGPGDSVLDVCAGTGELGTDLRRRIGQSGLLMSVDFSLPMLDAGSARFSRTRSGRAQADALNLPFADERFDAAIVAFGLRNVADPRAGLAEMTRVVKQGGRVVVLEFSQPRPRWFADLFRMYSTTMMPLLGGLISGTREAYVYLPESVSRWKSRDELAAMMESAGLVAVRQCDLTMGIACVHVGTKR
jgi:demethylmenaquinone methyltransferase/2-methoxy-6-polyprenyl-1,4-benzoquinol methylase